MHGPTIVGTTELTGSAREVRVRLAGDHKPMVMAILTLAQGRKSRLVDMFEQHCRRFVSDAYIPGMVAPIMERRTFLGPAAPEDTPADKDGSAMPPGAR